MLKHLGIFAFLIIVAFIGCIKNDAAINVTIPEKYKTAPIDEDYSHIQDPEERWNAYGLTDYVVVEGLRSFSLPGGLFKVFVVNSEIKEIFII